MVVGLAHTPEAINERELQAYEYSEAGLVSGFVTRSLIQPLDVLKIRFQLQEEPLRGKFCGKYTGIFQSVSLILQEEGYQAFWKGHLPAQGLSGVYGLVQFTAFEILSKRIKESQFLFRHYDKSVDFFCGALAGCAAMTAAMPLDVIRTRLVAQGEPKLYRGAIHAAIKIWHNERISGFFCGITPSLAQIAPFTGLQFTCYNFLYEGWKRCIINYESFGVLICGATAGIFAKTVLYPLDLVRHRLQVNSHIRKGFGRTTTDNGMIRTLKAVIRRESIFGLFKGLAPSIIKAGANSGFSFLFYELVCDILRSF